MSEKVDSSKSTPAKGKPTAKKTASRPSSRTDKGDGASAVAEMIAAMPEPDRSIGERLHAIIQASAPVLSPRHWYGMPAYAMDGKVICFYQSAAKFKTRYGTLGFLHDANLDDGDFWPTAYALKEMTTAVEKRIGEIVKQAVS